MFSKHLYLRVVLSILSRSNESHALGGYCYSLGLFEPSRLPSGARTRTNTEVGLALPSVKPRLPRGLLRGEPPESPEICLRFFKKLPSLSFVRARKSAIEAQMTKERDPSSRETAYASGIRHLHSNSLPLSHSRAQIPRGALFPSVRTCLRFFRKPSVSKLRVCLEGWHRGASD